MIAILKLSNFKSDNSKNVIFELLP